MGLVLPVNTTGSNPTLLLHSPQLSFEEFHQPSWVESQRARVPSIAEVSAAWAAAAVYKAKEVSADEGAAVGKATQS
jgi:hypothetical protein